MTHKSTVLPHNSASILLSPFKELGFNVLAYFNDRHGWLIFNTLLISGSNSDFFY